MEMGERNTHNGQNTKKDKIKGKSSNIRPVSVGLGKCTYMARAGPYHDTASHTNRLTLTHTRAHIVHTKMSE